MNKIQRAEFEILLELDRILKENEIDYYLYAGTLLGAVRHQGFIPWDDDIDIILTRTNFNKIEAILAKKENLSPGYHYQSNAKGKYYTAPFSKLRNNKMAIKEAVPMTQVGNYGPWVDLFVYDNIPDDEQLRIKQFNKVTKYNKIIKFFTTMQAQEDKSGVYNSVKNMIRIINEKFFKLYFFLPYLYRKRIYYMTMYNDIETEYSASLCYMFHKNYQTYSKTFTRNINLQGSDKLLFEGVEFPVPLNVDEILSSRYGNYMELPPIEERKVHGIIYLD